MSFWTAVVIIVAIGAFVSLVRSRHRAIADGHGSEDTGPSPREQELEQEVTELRDRIHVLERIATERNSSSAIESRRVAEDIEALRAEQDKQES